MQSHDQIATNRTIEEWHAIQTKVEKHPKRWFQIVLIAQLAAAVIVSIVVAVFSSQPHLAISAGYGATIMLVANIVLARCIQAWSRQPSADRLQSKAITVAGGRFVLIIILLITAYFAGLWLPAVAGGMLVAQIAVYLAGFWLLVYSDETKNGIKGEEL